MESLTLTSPQTPPSVTTYTVEKLVITRNPPSVDVTVKDNNGVTTEHTYVGAANLTLLNTGNFSVNSMQKQIITKLKNDGFLPAGTVSGTPD